MKKYAAGSQQERRRSHWKAQLTAAREDGERPHGREHQDQGIGGLCGHDEGQGRGGRAQTPGWLRLSRARRREAVPKKPLPRQAQSAEEGRSSGRH